MPSVLEVSQASLQESYIEGGKSAWRHKEIVEALRRDSLGKCMYCESFMDDVSYGAVEHIWPKSLFEDRALEWENLGYCCTRCNTSKGAYWDADEELRVLDPYKDDVQEYLRFAGPITLPRGGSTRGSLTLHKLKLLDLMPLVTGRMKAIQALEDSLVLWERESRPGYKDFLAERVVNCCALEVEYTAVLRSYAVSRDFPAPADW